MKKETVDSHVVGDTIGQVTDILPEKVSTLCYWSLRGKVYLTLFKQTVLQDYFLNISAYFMLCNQLNHVLRHQTYCYA